MPIDIQDPLRTSAPPETETEPEGGLKVQADKMSDLKVKARRDFLKSAAGFGAMSVLGTSSIEAKNAEAGRVVTTTNTSTTLKIDFLWP